MLAIMSSLTVTTGASTARHGAPPPKVIVPVPLPVAVGLLLTWFIATVVGTVWFAFEDEGFWLLSGSAACLIITLPLVVQRDYDLVSPWSVLLLGGYLGYGVRSLFIGLEIDGVRTIDDLYLLGQPVGAFFVPTQMVVLGLALLTIGYLAGGGRPRAVTPRFGTPVFRLDRVPWVVAVSALIGAASFRPLRSGNRWVQPSGAVG